MEEQVKAFLWWDELDNNTQEDLIDKWIIEYYLKTIKEEEL